MNQVQKDAQRAFQDADDLWSAELQRTFGRHAGDMRYTRDGMGTPGSALRVAYYGFQAAGQYWRAVNGMAQSPAGSIISSEGELL